MLSILKKILGHSKANFAKEIVPILQQGGVGILPTDTLYGIVGSALSPQTVERIYQLRKRNQQKPMIILVSDLDDLKLFDIKLNAWQQNFLHSLWPAKASVVLDCQSKRFEFLHRGKNSLAFRVPQEKWLREFLRQTGPLVAPSANFEGDHPSLTINDAKKYFDDKVDFYLDFGKLKSKPSTIVELEVEKAKILRSGAAKIKM